MSSTVALPADTFITFVYRVVHEAELHQHLLSSMPIIHQWVVYRNKADAGSHLRGKIML
jgi:hypothetical protein